MQIFRTFFYYLIVGLFHLLSFLPLSILYAISSLTSMILFSLFRYKRALVFKNLTRVFPAMNQQMLHTVAKQTYRHHLDVIAELIKTLRLEKEEFAQRVTIKNPELLEMRLEKDDSVLLVISHYGNWEWLQLACATRFKKPLSVVYKRISHSAFDRLFIKLRTRFGSTLIATDQIALELQKRRQSPLWMLVAADLSPRPEETRYWSQFLGTETAFYSGIPRIAKMTQATILYGHMHRISRGRYELSFELLAQTDESLSEADIMKRYINALESDIRKTPANWIWFYKRWKHERPQSEQIGQYQRD